MCGGKEKPEEIFKHTLKQIKVKIQFSNKDVDDVSSEVGKESYVTLFCLLS